jgi:hypothetical protein
MHQPVLLLQKDDIIDSSTLQAYLERSQEREKEEFMSTKAPAWLATQEELPFACTECGRCCKTSGDVYLSPEEMEQATQVLNITPESFIDQYVSHTLAVDDDEQQPWIKLKEQPAADSCACIFLDETTNHCRIYEARPAQCRTYPFWPQFMVSVAAWDSEARRMDDDTTSPLPPWTLEGGGCEGLRPMSAVNATEGGVSRTGAMEQLYDYVNTERRFPHSANEMLVEPPV